MAIVYQITNTVTGKRNVVHGRRFVSVGRTPSL